MSAQEEEQMRAAYEEELSRISATDMIAQAAVSLLNIGARRLVPPAPPAGGAPEGPSAQAGERDLEQARDAIDAARALLEILERRLPAQELAPLRQALSRLQMTYARDVAAQEPHAGGPAGGAQQGPGGGGSSGEGAGSAGGGSGDAPAAGERPQGPGPAESSGRLWVPGR